jgi:predicted amidophosphoribosyltransferase
MSIFIRRPDPTRCHHCGERVTAYAAGCWLCGTELDPQRWQRTGRAIDRLAERWRAFVRRDG